MTKPKEVMEARDLLKDIRLITLHTTKTERVLNNLLCYIDNQNAEPVVDIDCGVPLAVFLHDGATSGRYRRITGKGGELGESIGRWQVPEVVQVEVKMGEK